MSIDIHGQSTEVITKGRHDPCVGIRAAPIAEALLSLALGVAGSPIFHNANWLWFTAFVGVNLLQSGFTRWCLMETIMRKLGAAAGN